MLPLQNGGKLVVQQKRRAYCSKAPGDQEWQQAFGFLEGMRQTDSELAVKENSESILRGCQKCCGSPVEPGNA